jgi:hypothetical protein
VNTTTFSKYLSGLLENISYPPEIKKNKNIGQISLKFKDEESMIIFFREIYKKGARHGLLIEKVRGQEND